MNLEDNLRAKGKTTASHQARAKLAADQSFARLEADLTRHVPEVASALKATGAKRHSIGTFKRGWSCKAIEFGSQISGYGVRLVIWRNGTWSWYLGRGAITSRKARTHWTHTTEFEHVRGKLHAWAERL